MMLLTGKETTTPLAASTAPRPRTDLPLSNVNCPPMTIRLPPGATTIDSTWLFAAGAHDRSAPLLGEKAARRVRRTPLAVLNAPPTWARLEVTAIARARWSREGAKVVTSL